MMKIVSYVLMIYLIKVILSLTLALGLSKLVFDKLVKRNVQGTYEEPVEKEGFCSACAAAAAIL